MTAVAVAAERREVLVVDDDEDIRLALSDVLQDEGYRVTCASNGAEALAYLRSGHIPSVMLLDLMMPVMDGWELRRQQMRDEVLAAVPVIVVTASGLCKPTLRDLEVADCLEKPLDLDVLLGAVSRCTLAPVHRKAVGMTPPTRASASWGRH
jgi:two-component system, chemotaxis family, chemotaxis protein CheY